MSYSDNELEALLADVESDIAERKESFRGDAPTKVREAVCAFANDLPGHGRQGVVFVGARDDGSAAGLDVTDELLRSLADVKTDGNILPPPTITVEKRRLRGADMAVVRVAPADSPPVRFRGRIWIRVGPRRGIATAQDERILNERRRSGDRPFDVSPAGSAVMADLDVARFEREYLPAAVAPDVLAANDRSAEERFAATKLIVGTDDPRPTVLGILVVGKDASAHLPGAYVQFLRVAGGELADPIVDEGRIVGTILDVARRLDEKLESHNRTAVDIASGPWEQRRSDYPITALQQLLRNALMHRTYEATHMPVRVTWYDDRIEIASPGGPFGVVTVENFGRPGIADYRNPNLAESMRVLGLVQRYGAGLGIVRRALEANGNPPAEFAVDPAYVSVVVRRTT